MNGEFPWRLATGWDVERILHAPKSEAFKVLRDKAVLLKLTGQLSERPRSLAEAALALIACPRDGVGEGDPGSKRWTVTAYASELLGLDHHPMAVRVRRFLAAGWRIRTLAGSAPRQSSISVFMSRDEHEVEVMFDGQAAYLPGSIASQSSSGLPPARPRTRRGGQ